MFKRWPQTHWYNQYSFDTWEGRLNICFFATLLNTSRPNTPGNRSFWRWEKHFTKYEFLWGKYSNSISANCFPINLQSGQVEKFTENWKRDWLLFLAQMQASNFCRKIRCQIWRKSIYLAFDLFVLLKHCVPDKISPLNKSTYIIKRTAHGQRPHVPFGACANEANSWKKAVRFVRIICSKLALHSPFFFNATIKLESVLSHTYSKSLNLGFFDDENNLMSVWNVERFSNPLTKLKLTLPNLGQRSTLILVLNH